MVSGIKSLIKSNIWKTIYPQKSIDIFKGHKQENTVNLLGTLAIIGNSKTTDIAKFVNLQKFPKSTEEKEYEFPRDTTDMTITELRLTHMDYLTNNFNRLLTGRGTHTHGGKKIRDSNDNLKIYPNPLDFGYVVITGTPKNDKGKFIPQYLLTLKGFFLIVGYDLTLSELNSVIQNASKVSMFFAYIKLILEQTSIGFVKEIFIEPIRTVMLRSRIFNGDDLQFYFVNFAEHIANQIKLKIEKSRDSYGEYVGNQPLSYFSNELVSSKLKENPNLTMKYVLEELIVDDLDDEKKLNKFLEKNGIGEIMDNTFYHTKPPHDWYYRIREYFYPKKDDEEFYNSFKHDHDYRLLYKVMKEVHYVYYETLEKSVPKIPRLRLRTSKYQKKRKTNVF